MTQSIRDWAIIVIVAVILIAAVFAASDYGATNYEEWHATSTTKAING